MPEYRRIFPSYDWDEDVWRVNQIVNLPHIIGKENIGFLKGVPNEEVTKSDAAIARWIEDNMKNCSCMITFYGEKTYLSKWCKYEIELATKLGKARMLISLEGTLNRFGIPCGICLDPYKMNNLYSTNKELKLYTVMNYSWIKDKGIDHIHEWIEDACKRAEK